MEIDIVVYDGIDEMDALGPFEVLRGAQLGGLLEVRLVTRLPRRRVTGAFGLSFEVGDVFAPGRADVVLVPGGGWAGRAERGAWGEVQRGDWLPLLAEAAEAGSTMASVCTGALLLAHAGVVGTRAATTHHLALDDLAATGATVVRERVVDDGDLVTGAGVTSGLDVALHLVERIGGTEAADAIADRMEHPRVRAYRT